MFKQLLQHNFDSLHKRYAAAYRMKSGTKHSPSTRNIVQQRRFVSSTSLATNRQYGLGTLVAVAFLSSGLGYLYSSAQPLIRADSVGSHGMRSDGPIPSLLEKEFAKGDVLKKAIDELKKELASEDAVTTDPDALKTYGSSENSYHPTSPHSAVVRPQSTDDVSKVMKIAYKYRVPVVAYGGGTSLEGHFSGYPTGSICLDMSKMDKILSINEADGDLICQPGARWEDVNATLREKGISMFFPLDPGPGATIGGMVGTGCSGTNAVRYGTAKGEWFLNLTVVLPTGEVIKTRRRARKSSTGFDTTKLFIGAEGTLGIVTEATLRLAPLLPTKVALAQFPDVQHATDAVQELLSTPYGPHIQCVELVDDYVMAATNDSGMVDHAYPVKDSLFFKIQGPENAIMETSEVIKSITRKHGSTHFEFAGSDEEAQNLWEARKYALISTMASVPDSRCWTTDVCVPVSKLPQLVRETKEDMVKEGLKGGVLGHVGDGNFHALILFRNEDELLKVDGVVHRLVKRAIALDGTCTGEHGVGVGKREYLVEELGEGTVDLMRKVKDTLDPLHILNPGKLYPDRSDNNREKSY